MRHVMFSLGWLIVGVCFGGCAMGWYKDNESEKDMAAMQSLMWTRSSNNLGLWNDWGIPNPGGDDDGPGMYRPMPMPLAPPVSEKPTDGHGWLTPLVIGAALMAGGIVAWKRRNELAVYLRRAMEQGQGPPAQA